MHGSPSTPVWTAAADAQSSPVHSRRVHSPHTPSGTLSLHVPAVTDAASPSPTPPAAYTDDVADLWLQTAHSTSNAASALPRIPAAPRVPLQQQWEWDGPTAALPTASPVHASPVPASPVAYPVHYAAAAPLPVSHFGSASQPFSDEEPGEDGWRATHSSGNPRTASPAATTLAIRSSHAGPAASAIGRFSSAGVGKGGYVVAPDSDDSDGEGDGARVSMKSTPQAQPAECSEFDTVIAASSAAAPSMAELSVDDMEHGFAEPEASMGLPYLLRHSPQQQHSPQQRHHHLPSHAYNRHAVPVSPWSTAHALPSSFGDNAHNKSLASSGRAWLRSLQATLEQLRHLVLYGSLAPTTAHCMKRPAAGTLMLRRVAVIPTVLLLLFFVVAWLIMSSSSSSSSALSDLRDARRVPAVGGDAFPSVLLSPQRLSSVRLWDIHNTDSKKLSMKKTNSGTAGHSHLNLRSVADKLRARHEASMLAAADMLRPGPRQNVARLWDTVALLAHDWQSAQDAARIEQRRRRRSTDEYVAPLVKTYRKGNSAAAASHALAEEEENRMRALRAAEAEAAAKSAAASQNEDEEYPSLFHPPARATLSPSSDDESDAPVAPPAGAASVAPAAAAAAAGAAVGAPPPVTLLPVVGVPSKPFLQMTEALLDSMHQTWKAQQAEKNAMAKKQAAGGGKAAN